MVYIYCSKTVLYFINSSRLLLLYYELWYGLLVGQNFVTWHLAESTISRRPRPHRSASVVTRSCILYNSVYITVVNLFALFSLLALLLITIQSFVSIGSSMVHKTVYCSPVHRHWTCIYYGTSANLCWLAGIGLLVQNKLKGLLKNLWTDFHASLYIWNSPETNRLDFVTDQVFHFFNIERLKF